MERTEDQKLLTQWHDWLEAIRADIRELLFAHRVFWKMDELQRTYPTPILEGPLGSWMAIAYFYWLPAGVRRQLDEDQKCVSLARLLRSIESNRSGFSWAAGVARDIKELESRGKAIIRYANNRVAHLNKKEYENWGTTKGANGPTAAQVGEWMDLAVSLICKYEALVTGRDVSQRFESWIHKWESELEHRFEASSSEKE